MAKLTGWLGNRVDSPAEIEVTDELAAEFMASRYYDPEYPTVRREIPVWLASHDGKNLAWEPREAGNLDAIDDLADRVRAIEKAKL